MGSIIVPYCHKCQYPEVILSLAHFRLQMNTLIAISVHKILNISNYIRGAVPSNRLNALFCRLWFLKVKEVPQIFRKRGMNTFEDIATLYV